MNYIELGPLDNNAAEYAARLAAAYAAAGWRWTTYRGHVVPDELMIRQTILLLLPHDEGMTGGLSVSKRDGRCYLAVDERLARHLVEVPNAGN